MNLEFNYKFDNKDYIITLQSISSKILITIEEEVSSIYWKKELDENFVSEITRQMGSYKSLEVFTKMLIAALSQKNDKVSLNFCSVNEIQQLSEDNNKSNKNSDNNNIKKYLLLRYEEFEEVVYPIQFEYLDKNGNTELLRRTIERLKNKIKNIKIQHASDITIPVNYTEYEKLKKENLDLINKIKLLEKNRQLGAVDNDDIYKNYSELNEEYNNYKQQSENKIKMLLKSIEDLKESKFIESQNNFHQKDKSKNQINDLEKKLEIATDMLSKSRKDFEKQFNEKNKEMDKLIKEIKIYRENEKALKVKVANLEKDLQRSKRENNYYRYGNSTPKSTRSYHTTGSANNTYTSSFSKKSSQSYLKKNLIPSSSNKPFNGYYKFGSYQYRKNYKPFNYSKNKKTSSSLNSHSSKGSSLGKYSKNSSIKSNNSSKSKGSNSKYNYSKNIKYSSNNYSKSYLKPKITTNNNYKKNFTSSNIKKNYIGLSNSKKNINSNNDIKTNNDINDKIKRVQNLLNQASGK